MITPTDKNPAYESCGWFRIIVLAIICALYLFAKCAMAQEIEAIVTENDGETISLDSGDDYLVNDANEFPVDSHVVIAVDDNGCREAITNEETGYQE